MLQLLLQAKGKSFSGPSEMEIVREIKEKKCYVSMNPKKEEEEFANGNSTKEKVFELNDGETLLLADELFLCIEVRDKETN